MMRKEDSVGSMDGQDNGHLRASGKFSTDGTSVDALVKALVVAGNEFACVAKN
jgi:hypothetical protein